LHLQAVSVSTTMKVICNLFLVLAFASSITARLRSDNGPRKVAEDKKHKTIPNQYIVVLNEIEGLGLLSESEKLDDVKKRANKLCKHAKEVADATTSASVQSIGDPTILKLYDKALTGFSVSNLSKAALADMLASSDVQYIEADQVVQLDAVQSSTPSWGLGRLDDKTLTNDFSYSYDFTGSSVVAFVIDSGILTSHTDFEGRATFGHDATGEGLFDGLGHGTHVATTIGGALYGVAKSVNIVAVKVFNSAQFSSLSWIIDGVDYVIAQKRASPNTDMVANLSLGSNFSPALNNAIKAAFDEGVVVVVAAGNENADACQKSPASETSAITVGATDSSDSKAWFSNYGTCVDIFAPGDEIVAGWIGSNTATKTDSGTSMAAPHVAGVAALILNQTPGISPAAVVAMMKQSASSGIVVNPGSGSPNLLVYTGEISSGETPPPAPCQAELVAWYDSGGRNYDCEWYAQSSDYCSWYGDKYENFGKTAKQACCACASTVISPPVPAPSPPPTPAPCQDEPDGWYEKGSPQFNCGWYAQSPASNCGTWGDSFENFGKTANQACCACGGGTN
jgi:subtilisin family serine protease